MADVIRLGYGRKDCARYSKEIMKRPNLSRRDFLAMPAAVFPGVAYRNYSRCLPDYLRELARRAYQARNAALAGLTTPDAVRRRQAWARETFWKLAGGMPERTPLNARTVGNVRARGYRVEKVIYEGLPNFIFPPTSISLRAAGRPFRAYCFRWGTRLTEKRATPISGAARDWRGSATWWWPSIPWAKASVSTTPTRP